MEEEGKGSAAAPVVERLMVAVEEIAAISDYQNAYRKQLGNLSRRIKLLAPMFDELKDSRDPIPESAARTLAPFEDALASAKELLRFGSEGSKIFLVLERDKIMKRFQEVTAQLEQALGGISFDELDISDEVREQVELVHAQFKRAKERIDMPDPELYVDLLSLYNKSTDASAEPTILGRLAEKLQLTTIYDLKQESLALHEMVVASGGGDPGANIEKMSMSLKKIKDFVQTQNPEMGTPANSKFLSEGNPKALVIPDDFRCPISLDLMSDPVIVATGQTYERACIEKWLASGHDTCPKTQQRLSNMSITPNYVLRSLIAHWCEANGVEPPKRPAQPSKPTSGCSSSERANIDALLCKLSAPNLEDQRSAAGELRLLAKRNADNRICIAEAGAIPRLINLLASVDPRTQEHAVTALLNLSICEENKANIIASGAVPGIVHVLRNGSMEARENAAATLFSLSIVDENKVTIGASGAIPALVSLLSEGTQRGKKDAATALFNLCIYQGNKGKAVRAGVVPLLMGLVIEPAGGMVDEALAILAILSSHPEGKVAIGAAEAVPVLVEVIRSGSPRNRENAAAVLLHLCGGEQQYHYLAMAQNCGVLGPLRELAMNGTDRGKRKAVQLLERMSRFMEQQQETQAQATSLVHTQVEVHAEAERSEIPPSMAVVDL
ncbi:protein spotted leaf 11 [Cocos nucifera]|uniref:U-box domain-containing protein 12 n=1 Tax=Cocos nucifera TaxID=13894 RepID=A0A8K0I565_COCNU|nr:protein spotted leaf 11 [Cocos nucifera]